MKVALYGRLSPDNHSPYIQQLFDELQALNCTLFVYEDFCNFIQQQINTGRVATFRSYEQLDVSKPSVVLSLGGDGTFLETIAFVRNSGIPILGINTGRLGFLANVGKEEVKAAVRMLIDKKYTLDKRTLIHIDSSLGNLFGDVSYGLNEVTILKKDTSAMITINAWVNGEFLNSYWADGLIIATPTGSTAYSLSCGGPIVVPGSENFVITPIAPHNLNVRPIVLSSNSVIKLQVESRSNKFLVSLDSRSEVIESTVEITIRKEDFKLNLIKLENQNFFNTIHNKLLWGLDKRN